MRISCIIPTYNEPTLSKTIVNVKMQLYPHYYEIVLSDDGSTDNTMKHIYLLVKNGNGLIKATGTKRNFGKGFAVYSGIHQAQHRIKMILDADLSVNASEIEKIDFRALTPPYIVKGQRVQKVKQPWYRILLGKAFKVLTWAVTGIYMDTQCPFWVVSVPDWFWKDMFVNGFAFDVEILYKAKKLGIPIHTIEVEYFNDPRSSVRLKHILRMAYDLFRIRKLHSKPSKYPEAKGLEPPQTL